MTIDMSKIASVSNSLAVKWVGDGFYIEDIVDTRIGGNDDAPIRICFMVDRHDRSEEEIASLMRANKVAFILGLQQVGINDPPNLVFRYRCTTMDEINAKVNLQVATLLREFTTE